MSEPKAVHETVLEATGARARLARVYAEALLAAAEKAGQADQVGEELHSVADEVFHEAAIGRVFEFGSRDAKDEGSDARRRVRR